MSLLVLAAIALAILAGISALVVGLASASWQVLLFLLLLVWLGTQRLLKQTYAPVPAGSNLGGDFGEESTVDRLSEPPSADSDTLIYRGAKYHPPTVVDVASTAVEAHELSGKYRGCTWKTAEPESTSTTQPPPAIEMKYRGARVSPPAQ